MNTYIGIDNGVSGSIGIVRDNGTSDFMLVPTFKQLGYQKSKVKQRTRVDFKELVKILKAEKDNNIILALERPMINPTRFQASISAMACLECEIIAIEGLEIGYEYIDSKTWQKALLPKGLKGSAELKKGSLQIGLRMYPQHKELIKKHKDCDGLLIAEYLRQRNK